MKFLLPFTLFVSFLLFSCSNNNNVKIPADILPPDTMVQVFADVYMVKASHQYNMPIDTSDTTYSTTFNYVWKKHKITDSIYKKNLDFYGMHPRLLDSVYEKTLNYLNQQKAKLLEKKVKG